MMIRVRLDLEYDGSEFNGWQRQPGRRTVQQELSHALSTVFGRCITPMGSGRTDAGVHALQQSAHADVPFEPDCVKLRKSLNGLLPEDIRILGITGVSPGWNSRRDALARFYRYEIVSRPTALNRHMNWYVARPLDLEVLTRCASLLHGTVNAGAFCKRNSECEPRTHLYGAKWINFDHGMQFFVSATHFHHRMVRKLVGLQVALAARGDDTTRFERALATGCGDAPTAPARGLCLVGPVYSEDIDLNELEVACWAVMSRTFPFLNARF